MHTRPFKRILLFLATMLSWVAFQEPVQAAFSDMYSKDDIKQCCRSGANINLLLGLVLSSGSDHADQQAVSAYRCQAIEALIECGADINTRDHTGRTVLHWAAIKRDVKVIELLLQHKANIDAQDEDGETVLHQAAYNRDAELVELLLRHKAQTEVRDKNSETPLVHAVRSTCRQKGDIKVVELFLQHKANTEAQDKNGETPLYHAISELSHFVCARAMGSKDAYEDTQLIELLLHHKADVKAKDKTGKTLFLCARLWNLPKTMALLVKNGADVNETREWVDDYLGEGIRRKRSALHCAITFGNPELVELLLQHKAHTEVQNEDGQTPLMLATCKGNIKSVKLLLQHNADVKTKDKKGMSPLLAAVSCYQEQKKATECLLACGATCDEEELTQCFDMEFQRENARSVIKKCTDRIKAKLNAVRLYAFSRANGLPHFLAAHVASFTPPCGTANVVVQDFQKFQNSPAASCIMRLVGDIKETTAELKAAEQAKRLVIASSPSPLVAIPPSVAPSSEPLLSYDNGKQKANESYCHIL